MPKIITNEEFIRRAKSIHGDKYDYSKVLYKKSILKVEIYCNTHREYFWQKPNNHLQGQGCIKCGDKSISNKLKLTQKDFILRSISTHNNFYNYDKVVYELAKTKVIVDCPIHGEFLISPDKHLLGQGCSKCGCLRIGKYQIENPMGWPSSSWEKAALKSKRFDSYKVYIIECWNEEERFIKIGRTFRTIKKRFNPEKDMPYNYKVLKIFEFNSSEEACILENTLKNNYKNSKYLPNINFCGKYECFNIKLIEDDKFLQRRR